MNRCPIRGRTASLLLAWLILPFLSPSLASGRPLLAQAAGQANSSQLQRQAKQQFESGNVNRAIQIWTILISRGMDVVPSLYNRAQAYLLLEQYGLALRDIQKIEELQRPAVTSNVQVLKGIALHETGDLQGALAAFNVAEKLDQNPLTYANRAAVLIKLNRLPQARADLAAAVARDPSRANLYNQAVVERRMGNNEACIRITTRLAAGQPGFFPAYTLRGICHYQNKSHEAALADLLRSNKLDPNQPDVYLHLGLSLIALNRAREANQFLLRAADLYLGQRDQEQYAKVMNIISGLGP